MIPLLYQGSVKDVRGPVQVNGAASAGPAPSGNHPAGVAHAAGSSVVFDYSDAYSVFDWGKMPDSLPHKGEALAIIAADWFEKIEQAETWKEFSKSPTALSLRKGNRFGAAFNELGELLQNEGLRTHYQGVLVASASDQNIARPEVQNPKVTARRTADVDAPFKRVVVKAVSVEKPQVASILGRNVSDYTRTREAPAPRLIPLEVVFRFSCPAGSSLIARVERDPQYLASIGYPSYRVAAGEKWDFPVLELFTKLESTDRLLTLSEGLAISGLTAGKLQEVLFKTAWVAGWVKSICAKKGLELADGKLEWAIDETGKLILVDAIGPDELRILSSNGVQLSKEFLRGYYRPTPWYDRISKAKNEAYSKGIADWKRGVTEGPIELGPRYREMASQLYQCLANELTGRIWFKGAWSLSRVISDLGELRS